ncbi:MAG: hypothetical protein P0S95_05245 [Rhabdochlamydiaceae bacterium]|nr:hypothetical protein [Candidatus Amphrikana amoebophyrae]
MSMYHGHPIDAGAHLLNALAVAVQGAINVEVANVLKGIIGILVSAVKLPLHTLHAIGCFFVALLATFIGTSGNKHAKEFAGEYFEKSLNSLGLMGKDVMNIVSCLGHAIPSWLAPLIFVACPPAGVALAVIKVLTKFAGASDLVGYGGTAILLYTKAKLADKSKSERPKAQAAWAHLKKELNPTQSSEGALLAFYAAHVFCEGVSTVLDVFIPGAGTAVKYGSYGVQALVGISLAVAVYKNSGTEVEMTPTPDGAETPAKLD